MSELGFLELITRMCQTGHEQDAQWFARQVRDTPCRWKITGDGMSELVTCPVRTAGRVCARIAGRTGRDASAVSERGDWFTMSPDGSLVERGWGVAR